MIAAMGELDVAAILLGAGADVNATNNAGQAALHFADNPRIARFLIDAGADRNAHARGGETPAQAAARQGRLHVLKVITNELLHDFTQCSIHFEFHHCQSWSPG